MSVLRVDGVHIHRGDRPVIRGLTFAADRGDLVALMGPSGSGKTTVLRAMAGLEPLSHGSIDVDGILIRAEQRPAPAQMRRLQRHVGFVFQFHHLFTNMDALHNVALAPVHVLKVPREQAMQRARQLLATLGVGDRAGALPSQLSGGEAQRVAIARALAVDPPLLLMDEPTASLDGSRRTELVGTLTSLAAEGRTIVIATHDEEFVRACVRRVVTVQ